MWKHFWILLEASSQKLICQSLLIWSWRYMGVQVPSTQYLCFTCPFLFLNCSFVLVELHHFYLPHRALNLKNCTSKGTHWTWGPCVLESLNMGFFWFMMVYQGLWSSRSSIPFHGIFHGHVYNGYINANPKKVDDHPPGKKCPRWPTVETLKKNWPICGIWKNVGVFLSFFIRFWGATSWTFTIGSSYVIICFANSKLTELSNLQGGAPQL